MTAAIVDAETFVAGVDPAELFGDRYGVRWREGHRDEANELLARHHYLGPLRTGGSQLVVIGERAGGEVVAAQVWRRPTARHLPSDGSWMELSRWCLTPAAGPNAGSRQHAAAVKMLRPRGVLTLVSYSDPSHGHTGALYRACGWLWAPTWHRLRTPPTGHGSWTRGEAHKPQAVKDRWLFHAAKLDPARDRMPTDDLAAVRWWRRNGTDIERRWAARSPYVPEVPA